ncbi:MAG: hypothetical protein AABW51_04615 [Nanoarchaeota archaeon]
MRERTFRRPSVREIFEIHGVNPSKLRSNSVEETVKLLESDGIFSCFDSSYKSAVRTVNNLRDWQIALFQDNFDVSREDVDQGFKSLDDFEKIDSLKVLRSFVYGGYPPNKMTKEFLENHRIWPYSLAQKALNHSDLDIENPPIGLYWIGSDNHPRAISWIRSTAGAEMKQMNNVGDFEARVLDKKPYGRNLRVNVASRSEEGREYEFTLFNLPIFEKDDPKQYSDWINIGHTSNDPDSNYRGLGHDKRRFEPIIWSAPAIFGFYKAMSFVRELGEEVQFRINPFPIPRDEKMIRFIDNLRLSSLIIRKDKDRRPRFDVLNKSHMDRTIGAKTVLERYENCWTHFGKKDFSFLYTPK